MMAFTIAVSVAWHGILAMPRYYFIIEAPESLKRRIIPYDDPEGEQLPSDAVAKDYGHRVIRELKESGFETAGAVLHIRDENSQTIHSIPFWLP